MNENEIKKLDEIIKLQMEMIEKLQSMQSDIEYELDNISEYLAAINTELMRR